MLAIPNAYTEFKTFIANNKPSQVKSWLRKYERGLDTASKINEESEINETSESNDSIYNDDTVNSVSLSRASKSVLISKWASGTFKPAEVNYTVHEKETLSFIKALEKFRIDLQPVTFIYQTDSSYTKDFLKYKEKESYNKGRLLRWSLKAQQFSFIPIHIKGEENFLADTLTREWKP